MKTKDAKVERFHLDAPMHISGLNPLNAHLPCGPESLGMLWDIFHRDVLETVHGQVQSAVEIAAVTNCDYIVGCQVTQSGQIEGLASFTVPAGDYDRRIFSAGSFEELVEERIMTIWDDMRVWAEEQGLALSKEFAAEVYPQDTVSQERPEMYCLYLIEGNEL
ncbi:MAG: GyrI-like domain-containing protein [Acutalibacter sp.]|nr:GyrI-like domain-containing protein [Acutalibacter sp.]